MIDDSPNPVHYVPRREKLENAEKHDEPGWYFWTETWCDREGPYETIEAANYALSEYCCVMLGHTAALCDYCRDLTNPKLPHPYKQTKHSGCALCGYGFGSILHNLYEIREHKKSLSK